MHQNLARIDNDDTHRLSATNIALLWEHWRAQLHLVMHKPWLAHKWLEQGRTLLNRFTRIYDHLCRQPRPVRRRLQRQMGASLVGAALALALANSPIQAASFNANDAATLIAAINAANDEGTNPGADTITLTDDITLTVAYNQVGYGSNGLPAITSDITIEGGDFTITAMNDPINLQTTEVTASGGSGSFRIFEVAPSGDLTLNQVTLTGGSELGGGNVYSRGALTINNSTLNNGNSVFGGSMLNYGGVVEISGSTFSDNSAFKYGGAIANVPNPAGAPPLSASSVNGGGSPAPGTITITNSTLTNNRAKYTGGAISNVEMMTISNSDLISNTARVGGAIINTETIIGPVRLFSSAVSGALQTGAATMMVTASELSGNEAQYSGGAIANDGELTINSSSLISNMAKYGGAIANYGYTPLTLSASAIDGACACASAGMLTVTNSLLEGNIATRDGGAIFNIMQIGGDIASLSSSSVTGDPGPVTTATIADSLFVNNNAGSYGGAIFNIVSFGSPTLTSSSLTGTGGPASAATVGVTNSSLIGNSAEGAGGGIANNATMTVVNSTLSGNMAGGLTSNLHAAGGGPTGTGGAIDNGPYGIATLSHATLTGNSANNNGGALYNLGMTTLERSLISGNTASNGAEIYNGKYDVTPGLIIADANNLFGSTTVSNLQAFYDFTPGASDITATSDGTVSTALTTILDTTAADNGGATVGIDNDPMLTHNLVAGSPAIDAAGDGGLDADQLGITRPQGSADDIGAIEIETVNDAISQTSVAASYNQVPQTCPATGTELPIHTVTPSLQNDSTDDFADLFFRVKTIEYTTAQGGMVPSLCNATTIVDNGGVGSMLAIPNGSLQGGDNEYNPADVLMQALEVGLPVRARYRINVDLFATQINAAGADASGAVQSYLGTFVFELDPTTEEVIQTEHLFLPLIVR